MQGVIKSLRALLFSMWRLFVFGIIFFVEDVVVLSSELCELSKDHVVIW